MEIISGKKTADCLTAEIQKRIDILKNNKKRLPKLVIIRIGEKPADISYQRGAVKRMDMVGIMHEEVHFEENISKEEFYDKFDEINRDENVDGILVLRPIPKHLDEYRLAGTINPEKDIDAISPVSMGKLMMEDGKSFAPCTAAGVIEMLKCEGIEIAGKNVVIAGRSNVVGKPLAMLFVGLSATVTICHSRTENIKETCKNAEILVAACGKARLINDEYVTKGAIVIDVGINLDTEGRLCGDVDIDSIENIASVCTPVPGGVGAVTTSMLAKQVLMAYENKYC